MDVVVVAAVVNQSVNVLRIVSNTTVEGQVCQITQGWRAYSCTPTLIQVDLAPSIPEDNL